MGNIFKGTQKCAPVMGNGNPGSDWWGPRKQWQPGEVPQGGFNPVYRAGQINPQKPAEQTNNFSLHKKPKEE
jgi:hypothetical protein